MKHWRHGMRVVSTEDADVGVVHKVISDDDSDYSNYVGWVLVGWDSGVTTPTDPANLRSAAHMKNEALEGLRHVTDALAAGDFELAHMCHAAMADYLVELLAAEGHEFALTILQAREALMQAMGKPRS